jgi:ribosomal-protein-alanine N-acetyltransferase
MNHGRVQIGTLDTHPHSGNAHPAPTNASPDSPVTVRSSPIVHLGVAARLARSVTTDPARTPNRSANILRTERLTLRALRTEDRDEFIRVFALSRAHLETFCPLGRRDADSSHDRRGDDVFERQLALSEGAAATGHACRLVAFDSDGRLVGGFNVNDISRGLEHAGELVFWLSADAQRRGYATEGLRAIVSHAFADLPHGLGLHRLVALIAPANEPCRRLATRVGLAVCPNSAPAMLTLNDRKVAHDVYQIFADIGAAIETEPPSTIGARRGVVEGKPSIAESIFGRGLLSILRTESCSHVPHGADQSADPSAPTDLAR